MEAGRMVDWWIDGTIIEVHGGFSSIATELITGG
jgi:hypothetical protein